MYKSFLRGPRSQIGGPGGNFFRLAQTLGGHDRRDFFLPFRPISGKERSTFFFRGLPKIHRIFGRRASPPITKKSEGTRRLPSKIAGAPDQRSKKNRASPYFFWISARLSSPIFSPTPGPFFPREKRANFLLFLRNSKKYRSREKPVLFLSEKGPSSAVEKKNLGFVLLPFGQLDK